MAKNEKEERIAVDELKKRIKGFLDDELYGDDSLFYRFLKARDFNIDNAETMLKEHLKWRKKYDVRNISKFKHPEVLEKYFSLNKLGHDKEGCVLRYVPSGQIDWIGLYASSKMDDIAKHVIDFFEDDFKDLKEMSEKTGKNVDKVTYIINMEGFTFAQATSKKVITSFIFLMNLYQDNYPETLKTIHIIEASTYFYLLFSLIKKFLPAAIVNKFRIYPDDNWREDLLKIIDADVLPAFLGGTRTDPDGNPMCLTFVNHGGKVPEKYYIHRSKRSLADLPGYQQLTLPKKGSREITLEVKEPDSYLEWEFETKSRDVGFGLFHEDDKGKKTEILPVQRIRTDEYAETGLYKCENVGKYTVVFDNSFSLLRKKDIFYKMEVIKPQADESDITN